MSGNCSKPLSSLSHDELVHEAIQLRQSRDAWKKATLYLADCHAATAEGEGRLKSISKYARKRFADICKIAAKIIRQGGSFEWEGSPNVEERVATRCEKAVTDLEE